MIVAALSLIGQGALTPAAFVDDLTAKHGYAAIGTSVSEFPAVTIAEAPENAEFDAALKTRWRIVRDGAMPGVFRPEIAPYEELFDEERYLRLRNGVPTARRLPLPATKADLARPGGVRTTVERLIELLDGRRLGVPAIYRRRTVLVRIDPARRPDPLALLGAITGGRPRSDGTLAFDPVEYRRAAVATLAFEAKRTDFSDDRLPPGDRRAYWEQRPIRLAMGASALYSATDAELAPLARAPRRTIQVTVPRLEDQNAEIVADLLDIWDRNGARPPFVRRTSPIPGVPQIRVNGGSGLGRIGVASEGSTSVRFL